MMMARRGMENAGCRGALLVMLLLCSAAVKAVLASADDAAMEAIRGYFAEGGDGAGVMYSRLSTLCDAFGSRQAGSAALEAAIDWQADRLREEGFEGTRVRDHPAPTRRRPPDRDLPHRARILGRDRE